MPRLCPVEHPSEEARFPEPPGLQSPPVKHTFPGQEGERTDGACWLWEGDPPWGPLAPSLLASFQGLESHVCVLSTLWSVSQGVGCKIAGVRGRSSSYWALETEGPSVRGSRESTRLRCREGPPCSLAAPSSPLASPNWRALPPDLPAAGEDRLGGTEGQTNSSQHRGGPEGCFLKTSLPQGPDAGDQGTPPAETPGRSAVNTPSVSSTFLGHSLFLALLCQHTAE